MLMNCRRVFLIVAAATVFTSTIFAQEVARPKAAPKAAAEVRDKASENERSKAKAKKRRADAAAKAKKRRQHLLAVMEKLNIGEGSVIADIGAGNGRDSWVFAEVVGASGRVYSEEIVEDKVAALKKAAADKKLAQVHAVLGKNDDPGLPPASVDMAFMHYVYHHFSQPREMLVGLWKSLKPGGYLVIVDRRRGTLQDWVPREVRAKKHHWLAETTVVREAREEGFAYTCCAEDCWPTDDQFVLVFQRPGDAAASGSDPDQPLPLDLEKAKRHLLSPESSFKRPVIVALGQARELIGPILQHASGTGVDVILEEWATQKDERPELPSGVSLPSVMTEKGVVPLGDEMVDAVFFLDTYHRLFHHEKTLETLGEKLAPKSRLYVLDRIAESELSRRESSHQRRISVDLVKLEMEAAGFRLLSQKPAPAADRMLLVFEKQ